VWVKDESVQPTGTFKDRLTSIAVEESPDGSVVAAISYGNTALSLAVGVNVACEQGRMLNAFVLLPNDLRTRRLGPSSSGRFLEGKRLLDRIKSGATVGWLPSYFVGEDELAMLAADALGCSPQMVIDLTEGYSRPTYAGIAHEVLSQLGEVPDACIVPYGAGILANEIRDVLVAVYIVIHNIRDPYQAVDIPDLITWQIGALALVVANRILEALPIAALSVDIEALKKALETHLPDKTPLSRFLSIHDPLTDNDFTEVRDLWLVGITLSRTLGTYGSHIRDCVKAGANVRILTVDDTNDDILNEYDKRYFQDNAPPQAGRRVLVARIQNANSALDLIRQAGPDPRGTVVVAKMSLYPPYGLKIFNPTATGGRCYGELYHHKSYGLQAHFKLNPGDMEWYNFFISQFKLMWQSAEKKTRLLGPSVNEEVL
jgi:hypothetical protein